MTVIQFPFPFFLTYADVCYFHAEIKHNVFMNPVKNNNILPNTDKKNKMSTDCLLYVLMFVKYFYF